MHTYQRVEMLRGNLAPLKILRHQHEVAGGRIPLTVDVATVADRLEQNARPAPPDEDRLEEEGIVGRPARHEMDKVVAVRPQIFTGGTVLDVLLPAGDGGELIADLSLGSHHRPAALLCDLAPLAVQRGAVVRVTRYAAILRHAACAPAGATSLDGRSLHERTAEKHTEHTEHRTTPGGEGHGSGV
uniref:Uncharacterized protein n=1 Tax=Anopheles atroparvus TaxID=41427 RepID=A0A182JC49_ANOAO